MAQAAKLFDQKSAQGQVSPGADKQSAVMKAGELALKMYMKGNKGGSTGTGGLGGLGAAGLVGAYLSGGGNKKDGSGGGLGGIAAELLSGATQGGSGGKQGGGSGSGGLLGSVGKLF